MGNKQKAPGETAAERAQADIGVERLGMTRELRPIREDLFKRLTDFRSRAQKMRDQGATDFAIASRPVKEAAARSGNAGGAATVGLDVAEAAGGNAAATESRAKEAEAKTLQGLSSMAVGESGEAIAGMSELARRSQEDAIQRSRAAAGRRASNASLIASGIGAVAGGVAGAKSAEPLPAPGTPADATYSGLSDLYTAPHQDADLQKPLAIGGY